MDMKVCPVCNQENLQNALACSQCGTSFTVKVAIDPTPTPDGPPQSIAAPSDLFLFVSGHNQPIVLRNMKEITLGRKSPNTASPIVDLTPYDEKPPEISRKHAMIEQVDGTYFLRDLGSTNGTWLNDAPLIPHRNYHLHPGDKIRLAQLAVVAYFKGEKTTEVTISLSFDQDCELTPTSLGSEILPVLKTIGDFQLILNTLLGRDPQEIKIESIKADTAENKIVIRLDRAQETLKIIQEIVLPWKTVNKNTDAQELKTEPLAQNIVVRIKPDLAVEKAQLFIEKLSPILLFFLNLKPPILFEK